MLTSQEEQRPGVQMQRWLPSLCSPPTSAYLPRGGQSLSTLHSIMLPICLHSSGGPGTGDAKAGSRSLPARPPFPPEPQLPGVGWRPRFGVGGGRDFGEGGCERLQEQQFRCGRSTGTVLGAGPERRKGQLWLLTTASPELSLIIRSTLCSIQSSCLGVVGPAEPALPREHMAPGVGKLASLTVCRSWAFCLL